MLDNTKLFVKVFWEEIREIRSSVKQEIKNILLLVLILSGVVILGLFIESFTLIEVGAAVVVLGPIITTIVLVTIYAAILDLLEIWKKYKRAKRERDGGVKCQEE